MLAISSRNIYRERERLVALADIRKTIVINELLQRIAIEFIRNFYSRTNFIPRVPCVAWTKPRRPNVDDFFVKETEGRKGEGDNRVSPGIWENLLLSMRETHGRARNVSRSFSILGGCSHKNPRKFLFFPSLLLTWEFQWSFSFVAPHLDLIFPILLRSS